MKPKTARPQSYPDKLLRNGVFLPAYIVGAVGLVTVMAYISQFHEKLKFPLSDSPAVWGAFGDYIGGVMNPLCAYMAFIWLVRSYALQKNELAETRKALKESHQAQLLQARISYATARIETANSRMGLLKTQGEFYRSRLFDLERQSTDWLIANKGIGTNPFALAVEKMHDKLGAVLVEHDRQVAKIAAVEEDLTAAWHSL